tara:strand:- start:721 stop:5157 length:4437 start_codon:yes stop_codon:yes gene_type:complete
VKLKLTLRRPAGAVDLTVTADATATVADVARVLTVADPQGAATPTSSRFTLAVVDPAAGHAQLRTLHADAPLAESGILSGATVHVVAESSAFVPAGPGGPALATLRVLTGPDAGREFALPAGASTVGRDRGADVRLSDPMVSKVHARINVADTIEILDLNSANGVIVGGGAVVRSPLAANDVVLLGDTSLCVMRTQQAPVQSQAAQIDHVRSPRVVPRFPGEEFVAPQPPKLPQRQRFPLIALAAPLIMGAVLWAITQQILGVIMMAMSPLLLVGAFVDQSLTAKRELKAQRKVFDESMLRTQERLEIARDEERRARLAEFPTTARLCAEAARLGPLLWTERAESERFLAINVGIGRAQARNQVVLPQTQDTLPECWDQLLALQHEFATIDGVPLSVDLTLSGSLGFAGPEELMRGVARAAVAQAAIRHSPADVAIAAVVSPLSAADWDWIKWLPHASSSHSPLEGMHFAAGRGEAGALLARIEGLIDTRLEGPAERRGALDPEKPSDRPDPIAPALVLIVENGAPVDRARLTRVAEKGPDAGIHVIWCAPRVEQLPAACRSFVVIDAASSSGAVGQVRLGERTSPVATEQLDVAAAEGLARRLAPVVDVGVPEADDSDLPRSVAYPTLAGMEILDAPDAIVERWRQNGSLAVRDGSPPVRRKKEGNLRAVVGHAGSEPFVLDLRADGPHALVGGTTGAGKSEFLQSWVLGMAAAHSPDRLTFLFVDYKGGSAFADCVSLPHTVGLVTDLSPHLVRRALTSLRAELRYREHVLNAKKAKDLVTLEKTGDPDCPPSLVIVVDEFAALVQEVPEFVDGVVDVAQRGRSLGLHLVLATQRPAGVIKDNLRANTNLRIALRMADADDSVDILGDKLAAYFDPSIPGRGAAKRGPGRLTSFQTGYVGGHTTGQAPPPRIDVRELDFGSHTVWEMPRVESAEESDAGPTDISRIVATVSAAAETATVPTPRKPWLNELAAVYSFSKLPNPRTDERLPLGVLDDPATQSQPTVFYEPDRDGNLAIYGTGGSGKSTALRTIAVAAAATTRNGGPTHVYGLDFGSRGLSMLSDLPHVGGIISGDDEERVIRLIRMLRDIVDDRATRYAAVNADTIGEFRRIAQAPNEPRILLLVDGIGAFKEQYEFGPVNLSVWYTAFAQIAADGRGLGVHIVVAGDRPNSVPNSIASTVQRRIVLRMANEDEYMMLGVAKDVLDSSSPAGRGIIDDNEVQIAILGESSNVAVQAREVKHLAAAVERLGGVRPAPVLRLPDHVALADLPAGAPGHPIIALDDVSLGPLAVSASGTLLIAGPPGSGRTTAVRTLAAAIERSDPSVHKILISPRRTPTSRVSWSEAAVGPDEASAIAQRLTTAAESARLAPTAVFIESLPEFTGTAAEFDLERLIRVLAREGHTVVGEGETSTWSQAYTLASPMKAGRRGLLLVPGEMDGETLMGTSLGRLRRVDFPAGRGFLVVNGRATKLQVAQVGP